MRCSGFMLERFRSIGGDFIFEDSDNPFFA